jgi:hypothetical protein
LARRAVARGVFTAALWASVPDAEEGERRRSHSVPPQELLLRVRRYARRWRRCRSTARPAGRHTTPDDQDAIDGLNREQVPHLLRFENAALRIDEWNAFALVLKSAGKVLRSQIAMDLRQSSGLRKRGRTDFSIRPAQFELEGLADILKSAQETPPSVGLGDGLDRASHYRTPAGNTGYRKR